MNQTKRFALKAYGWLLKLYPASFHAEFCEEMSLVFEMRLREDRSGWSVLGLVCKEVIDLPSNLIGAYAQSRGALMPFGMSSRKQMLERTLLLLLGSLLAILSVGGVSLVSASSGPENQPIHGLAIGHYDAATLPVYISGRKLECAPANSDKAANCEIEISGQLLQVYFIRNPESDAWELDGACTTRYAGQEWPCRVGSRLVSDSWFAYLDEPLGLGEGELDQLRQQNLFQNLGERQYVQGASIISGLLIAVLVGIIVLKLWNRVSKWTIIAAPAAAFMGFMTLNWLLILTFIRLGYID